MNKALAFLKTWWLEIVILLIVLWTLPRITDFIRAASDAFFGLFDRIERKIKETEAKVNALLAVPGNVAKAVGEGLAKLHDTVDRNPWTLWTVPIFMAKRWPKAALFLAAWQVLDTFKDPQPGTYIDPRSPQEINYPPAARDLASPFLP